MFFFSLFVAFLQDMAFRLQSTTGCVDKEWSRGYYYRAVDGGRRIALLKIATNNLSGG